MALLAIFLAGLLAPFVIVYGALFALLALPLWAGLSWARPHWSRLPRTARSTALRALIWASSAALWIAVIHGVVR